MTQTTWSIQAKVYYAFIVLAGLYVLGKSALTLFLEPEAATFLVLAFPIALLSRAYIQLPNCDGRISPSSMLLMYGALASGNPAVASILAATEGAASSTRQTADTRCRLLFNTCALALAMAVVARFTLAGARPPREDLLGNLVLGGTLALSYFIVSMTVMVGMIVLVAGARAIEAMKSAVLWSWAEYLTGGLGAALIVIVDGYWGLGSAAPLLVIIPSMTFVTLRHYFDVLRAREKALQANRKLLKEKEELVDELHRMHIANLETLATAIEAKDPATHGHVRRVQRLAEALGRSLELPPDALEALRIAALLHDVGKLALPDYVLYHRGDWSEQEIERYESHARLGAGILKQGRLDPRIVPAVLHHHERFDGSGYPDGLAGSAIPLEARILAVADVYDRILHPRGRPCLGEEEALAKLAAESGKALDPKLVAPFLEHRIGLQDFRESTCEADPEVSGGSEGLVDELVMPHLEARILHCMNDALRGVLETEGVMNILQEAMSEAVRIAGCVIYMPDFRSRDLEVVHAFGPDQGLARRLGERVLLPTLDDGDSGWIALDSELLSDALTQMEIPEARRSSWSIIPLSEEVIDYGFILISTVRDAGLLDREREFFRILLEFSVPVMVGARAHERTRWESSIDELTGLGNVRYLRAKGKSCIASSAADGRRGSVVVVDLNGFKAVNDTFGHQAGDRLLTDVAAALKRCFRPPALITRTGGDEFVILVPGDPARLDDMLERAGAQIRDVWPRALLKGPSGPSFGIAYYPDDSVDLDALLEVADQRMYESKRASYAQRGLVQGVRAPAGENADVLR